MNLRLVAVCFEMASANSAGVLPAIPIAKSSHTASLLDPKRRETLATDKRPQLSRIDSPIR